jgi:hypothetical protein
VFEASVDSLENLPSSAVHQLARCLRGPPVADPVLTTAFQAIGSAVDPLEVKVQFASLLVACAGRDPVL